MNNYPDDVSPSHPYFNDDTQDRFADLCCQAGEIFTAAEAAGFKCELTANPSKTGGADWRLAISGTTGDDIEKPQDVDAHAIDVLEDLVGFLQDEVTRRRSGVVADKICDAVSQALSSLAHRRAAVT